MALSDSMDILLAHDRWATRQVLSACEALSHDQLHQAFDMGVGSLHDTIRHVLGAMRGWTDMLNGEYAPGGSPRPRLEEEGEMSVAALLDLHERVADELERAARAGAPEDLISGVRGGKNYTFTRGGIVTHVTTHAMHHRAQCLNMLRRLGVERLPPTSVVEWMMLVDPVE